MAFLGNLLSKDVSHDFIAQSRISTLSHICAFAMFPFAFAMLTAILSAGLGFITNLCVTYSHISWMEGSKSKGDRFQRVGSATSLASITAGVGAFVLMVVGTCRGLSMLNQL